ncbi:sulfotransferase family protein [Streptomyces sp. NBC_01294]|uniref:sulfotransferase family protein n=1 Tax=Streptomyces sp. NBC_01294 TaxID=2903815 RepID=UPI002DDA612F|nr:sulfotransferase [Streptomyces sp. NBC_01294]WRZ56487.1 sulfotransferase [Streptomyces sp. NBC_01294]
MRERTTGYAGFLDMEDLVRPSDSDTLTKGREAPFQHALERFVDSINSEARLSPSGVAAVRSRIKSSLAMQRRVSALRPPSSPALDAPVFITGMPGTGAALLHNLLAEHPGVDAPAMWELADPASGAETPGERRALIARGRAHAVAGGRTTAGRAVGLLRQATRPGSCQWLLANTFHSPALSMAHHVPSYSSWMEGQDMVPAYGFHRLQLQAVCNRVSGGALVLRDPFHAPYLSDLVRVYPRARIIRMHRDPADVLASTAGIAWSQRIADSAGVVDPAEVGAEWADWLERHFADAEASRTRIGEDRILDIRHADLVGDPVATLRRATAFVGVPTTPVVEQNMVALAREAAMSAQSAWHFEPEEFGLSRRELGQRFAEYRRTYGA